MEDDVYISLILTGDKQINRQQIVYKIIWTKTVNGYDEMQQVVF